MQWVSFLRTRPPADRQRWARYIEDARAALDLAQILTTGDVPAASLDQVAEAMDQALDALSAARLLLPLPPVVQPEQWRDGRVIRVRTEQLAALQAALQERRAPTDRDQGHGGIIARRLWAHRQPPAPPPA